MDRIVQLFKDPDFPWTRSTLNWWNKYFFKLSSISRIFWLIHTNSQVEFSRSKSSGDDTEDDLDDEHAISIDDLLQTAGSEEDEHQNENNPDQIDDDDGWPANFRQNATMTPERNTSPIRDREAASAREREAATVREREAATVREREAAAAREREAAAVREREAAAAREQEAAAVREREAAATREREAAAVREREAASAREREATAARQREAAAAREREAKTAMEWEAETLRERGAPEQEAATQAARTQVPDRSGLTLKLSRKRFMPEADPDSSDLSGMENLPPPQLVKTKQPNRGTGRQQPSKRRKK